jgi:hypothetical protein
MLQFPGSGSETEGRRGECELVRSGQETKNAGTVVFAVLGTKLFLPLEVSPNCMAEGKKLEGCRATDVGPRHPYRTHSLSYSGPHSLAQPTNHPLTQSQIAGRTRPFTFQNSRAGLTVTFAVASQPIWALLAIHINTFPLYLASRKTSHCRLFQNPCCVLRQLGV